MVDVEIDLSALEELTSIEEGIEPLLERCVDRGTEIVFNLKLGEIAKTEASPIPTRGQVKRAAKQIKAKKPVRVKGGRKSIGVADPKASDKDNEPAWKHTGAWADGQRIEKTGQFERTITTTGKAADYEARLADLPDGALGINRTRKASENARNQGEQQMEAAIEQEVRNVLGI